MLITNGTSLKNIHKSRKAWLFVFAAILLAVLAAFVFYTQELSSKIDKLQSENHLSAEKLASYKRTLCTDRFNSLLPESTTKYVLAVDGAERVFYVHTPKNYDASVRYPVVFSFDGIGGFANNIESYSGMNSLPVIAVYPEALPSKKGFSAWQGAPYSLDGDYDINFVKSILSDLPSKYCVDDTRIFAVGMSNGGGFAEIIGCRMSDRFRAVAGVSGAYYTQCDSTKRTASLLAVHSTIDKQVPFEGSKIKNLPQLHDWIVEESLQRGCQKNEGHAERQGTISYDWSGCNNNSILRLLVIKDQEHGWLAIPQGVEQDAVNTTEYIWRFFEEASYAG